MLKRYELTNQEWEKISPLLPLEQTNKPGRHEKATGLCLMPWYGLQKAAHHGWICQNITVHGKVFTAGFANGWIAAL